MKTCPKCGRENLERAKFCGYCGRSLTVETDITRRVYPEGDINLNQAEQSVLIRDQQKPKAGKTSLYVRLIVLFGLLVVGSILVIGLNRFQTDEDDKMGLMTYLMPVAEQTPTETAILIPTPTPLPSSTSAPTLTPLPTNTPIPIPLGARVSEIQTIFANLGFTYHKTSPLGNQPRIIGRSIDKSVSIELVGVEDKLLKATLIGGESNIGDQNLVIMVYMTRLLHRLLPEWTDAKSWLEIGLKQIANSKESEPTVATTSGNYRVSLKKIKEMELLMLFIEGEYLVQTPGMTPTSQTP